VPQQKFAGAGLLLASLKIIVQVRQKKLVLGMSHHQLTMILGGISYLRKFWYQIETLVSVSFRDNWDIPNFVPAHYFFIETHWAKWFFYKTLVCFRGVTKPSFSDGFSTCFSFEFLFTKIDPNVKMTH
jgi:hypothetical protein